MTSPVGSTPPSNPQQPAKQSSMSPETRRQYEEILARKTAQTEMARQRRLAREKAAARAAQPAQTLSQPQPAQTVSQPPTVSKTRVKPLNIKNEASGPKKKDLIEENRQLKEQLKVANEIISILQEKNALSQQQVGVALDQLKPLIETFNQKLNG